MPLPYPSNKNLPYLSQTVSENARLELNPSKYIGNSGRNGVSGGGSGASAANGNTTAPDDDFELWDYSGFMLRNDTDDPITNGKLVFLLTRKTKYDRLSFINKIINYSC